MTKRVAWTALPAQTCDGCGQHREVLVLHVGRPGERPLCPLAALCRGCIVDALAEDAERPFGVNGERS